MLLSSVPFFFFFLNDPAPPEFYPLPLHDALPISLVIMALSRRLRIRGPGPPFLRCRPLEVCVNLPWTTTPSYAAVCQCQPESMPAGNFCTISKAPSFGFPHTTDIISPGYLGSTGFHGMAMLAVKVPWVAPAFALAGVASVPRACAKDSVVIVVASTTTTLVNTLLFSIRSLLFRFSRLNRSTAESALYGYKAAVDRQI